MNAMNALTDPACLRALLREEGFTFSKSMGQNFLIDASVPRRIAEESGAGEGCLMLEIGPGVGCLTRELCALAERVVSIELDERLRPVHRKTLGDCENLRLVYGDFLKTDFDSLFTAEERGLTPRVAANLPYNITSPALTKLLKAGRFESITVMVQLEVARRIAALPGTADYGAFTLLCQYYAAPRLLFRVPASSFEPRPKVESAVVRLERRERPPVEAEEELLFRVIRAAFNQRRKTLLNALSAGFPEVSKASLREILLSAGLDERVRGEALSLAAFAAITRLLPA
ncbi:MAG: 16S rRNA (adenine(1518)-N(6)/adenine(1519)-N(6))-dimethyltransferase RsmA [bacterium]